MEDESCVTCQNMTEDQKDTLAFLVVFILKLNPIMKTYIKNMIDIHQRRHIKNNYICTQDQLFTMLLDLQKTFKRK